VGRMNEVQFLAGTGFFFYPHVQAGSGAHLTCYPMGTGGSFLWGEVAGA